jgi:hypothetical protein
MVHNPAQASRKKEAPKNKLHVTGDFMSAGDYIVFALMLATFGILMAGIVLMGVGGSANTQYGNKLMTARVSFQGLVLIMLALIFFIGNP